MKKNQFYTFFILISCYSQTNNNIAEKQLLLLLNNTYITNTICDSLIIESIQLCFKTNYSIELNNKVEHFIIELELQRSLDTFITTENRSACKSVITPLKSMIISKKYAILNYKEKAKSIITDFEESNISPEIFNFLLSIVIEHLSLLEREFLLNEYSNCNNEVINTTLIEILADLYSAKLETNQLISLLNKTRSSNTMNYEIILNEIITNKALTNKDSIKLKIIDALETNLIKITNDEKIDKDIKIKRSKYLNEILNKLK